MGRLLLACRMPGGTGFEDSMNANIADMKYGLALKSIAGRYRG
jgi:hypothetical protein